MGSITTFEQLEAWQRARALTREIYQLCQSTGLKSDFVLRDQIRRAAISAMSNVAEGWERTGRGEKLQFYGYARSSCGEVRSLCYVCEDAGYWSAELATRMRDEAQMVGRLISGLIRSVESR